MEGSPEPLHIRFDLTVKTRLVQFDLTVVFTALCRALGIPARTVTCVWFHGSGHQWAEVLLPPYNFPVDTSVGQMFIPGNTTLTPDELPRFLNMIGWSKNRPEEYFGQLYPNRLIVSIGNNLECVSRTTGISRTFRFLQPGAGTACPPAVEFGGLKSAPAHAGSYALGKKRKKIDFGVDFNGSRDFAARYLEESFRADTSSG